MKFVISIAIALPQIRRPLSERERASSHCQKTKPSNPADSNQPLLQYLAISHPADCNLAILQSAAYWLQHSTRGRTNPELAATARHRPANPLAPDGIKSCWNQCKLTKINENSLHMHPHASICIRMHPYGPISSNWYQNVAPMSQKPLTRYYEHMKSQNWANQLLRHAFCRQIAPRIQLRIANQPSTHICIKGISKNRGRRQRRSL